LSRRIAKLHANLAAFGGSTKEERRQRRDKILLKYHGKNISEYTDDQIFAFTQNRTFPVDLYKSEKLMVILVPEHNAMSGGIFSFFSIATQMRRLKPRHGYDIIMMTRPNKCNLTYFRNTNFSNSENVYRFEQILLCQGAKEVYLQIPEYATEDFFDLLSFAELNYLRARTVYINILNQNIKLMPERDKFSKIYQLSNNVTQSVAHHAYFNQHIADKYDLPTLLLPPYTDLSAYPPSKDDEKEGFIIYSPDEADYKTACLEKIRAELPEFTLVEIKDITFDNFMDHATRCLFSITFGEGFDGYLAQPIHQGGIGFAVYDERFFPSVHFKKYYNIFSTPTDMTEGICDKIRFLNEDREFYRRLNSEFVAEYERLYKLDDYIGRLAKLARRQFEIFPSSVRRMPQLNHDERIPA